MCTDTAESQRDNNSGFIQNSEVLSISIHMVHINTYIYSNRLLITLHGIVSHKDK